MSWRSYASISIPKKYLTPEVMKIVRDCVSHADDLSAQIVQFYSDNAPNGQFEDLEAELIEMVIPFDRYSGQDFNIDSETRYYRPAMDGSPEVDATVLEHRECGEFIPVSEIRRIIGLNPEDFKAKVQELLEEWVPSISPLSQWA
jgi:hypothetical protein